MLWGDPQRERADLNIDTLWSGGPRTARIENSKALLADLRAAVIERRDYAEADALVRGLQGPFNEAYQPLGRLTVDFDGISGHHNYERSLDLSEGVAAVRYEANDSVYEREAFVSHARPSTYHSLERSRAAEVGLGDRVWEPASKRKLARRRRYFIVGR